MENKVLQFITQQPSGEFRTNRASMLSRRLLERKYPELRHITESDRLVSADFTYTREDIYGEVLKAVNGKRYEGYPEAGLKMTHAEYQAWVVGGRSLTDIVGIPGNRPMFYVDHPNRYNKDGSLKKSAQDLSHLGLNPHEEIPFHPLFEEVTTDENSKGFPTGPGFFYHLGANKAADPVVFRKHKGKLEVLLIDRTDSGGWALAGGHIEKVDEAVSEDPRLVAVAAAKRELKEEALAKALGVNLDAVDFQIILADVPVAGSRATANAWHETTVVLLLPDEKVLKKMKPRSDHNETKEAKWMSIEDALAMHLNDSHNSYVKLALLAWERRTGLVVDKEGKVGIAA